MLANFKNSWNSDIILVEDVFRPYFLSTVNLSYHKIDNANGLFCFSLTLFLPPCIQLWSIKLSIFLSVPEHRRSTRFHKHRCLQFQLCDTKRWRRIQNDGHIIVLLRLRPSTLFIFPFVFFFSQRNKHGYFLDTYFSGYCTLFFVSDFCCFCLIGGRDFEGWVIKKKTCNIVWNVLLGF